MPDYPFTISDSVTLDATGSGQASVTPLLGQHWVPTVASIHVDTAVLMPECRLYIGSVSPENFVDGTYTGALNSTDAVKDYEISQGQRIIAVWVHGDVGAEATLTVRGMVRTAGAP